MSGQSARKARCQRSAIHDRLITPQNRRQTESPATLDYKAKTMPEQRDWRRSGDKTRLQLSLA